MDTGTRGLELLFDLLFIEVELTYYPRLDSMMIFREPRFNLTVEMIRGFSCAGNRLRVVYFAGSLFCGCGAVTT